MNSACERALRNFDPISHENGDNFSVFVDLTLQTAGWLNGYPPDAQLLMLAADAVKDQIRDGKTVSAFRGLKILDEGGLVPIIDYDVRAREGRRVEEHSLNEGKVGERCHSEDEVIVIKDGKWYIAKKGSESAS